MILREIGFEPNTEDDEPVIKSITVTMTLPEATALRVLAGSINGHAQRKLGLVEHDSLYDCLADLFNRFYDDGLPPGARHGIDLATLNDKP